MGPRFTRGLCRGGQGRSRTACRGFQWGRALRADCVCQPSQTLVVQKGAFQWGRALRADCVPRGGFSRCSFMRTSFNGAALYARIVSVNNTGRHSNAIGVSMGPRFTRGLCQGKCPQSIPGSCPVSMGPRFTRGLCHVRAQCSVHRRDGVSMGPRFTRGLCPAIAVRGGCRSTCFNGAALYARIVPCMSGEHKFGAMSGFNGAALYARIVSTQSYRREAMSSICFNGAALYARIVSPHPAYEVPACPNVSMGPRFTRGLCPDHLQG